MKSEQQCKTLSTFEGGVYYGQGAITVSRAVRFNNQLTFFFNLKFASASVYNINMLASEACKACKPDFRPDPKIKANYKVLANYRPTEVISRLTRVLFTCDG